VIIRQPWLAVGIVDGDNVDDLDHAAPPARCSAATRSCATSGKPLGAAMVFNDCFEISASLIKRYVTHRTGLSAGFAL
jgi:hypothetical protein